MPTNLEKVAVMLISMTPLELDAVKGIAQKLIEEAPSPTDCKFLTLAAELRDMVYHRTTITHLAAYGALKDCALLRANRQIRDEFAAVAFDDNLARVFILKGTVNEYNMTITEDDDGGEEGEAPDAVTFRRYRNPKFLRAVLAGGRGVEMLRDSSGRYLLPEASLADDLAIKTVETKGLLAMAVSERIGHHPDYKVYGVLEVVDGEDCHSAAFAIDQQDVERLDLLEDLKVVLAEDNEDRFVFWS